MSVTHEKTIIEQRKKALVLFLKIFNLSKEYSISKYKTVYGFIRYNYKHEFYEWVKFTEYKTLFLK